jgi:hypothetical protein
MQENQPVRLKEGRVNTLLPCLAKELYIWVAFPQVPDREKMQYGDFWTNSR